MDVKIARPSGEWDPHLPERIKNPTKEQLLKKEAIEKKYKDMREKNKH